MRRAAWWVEPVLVADIEYREVSGDGLLRHPSFRLGMSQTMISTAARRIARAFREGRRTDFDIEGNEVDPPAASKQCFKSHRN